MTPVSRSTDRWDVAIIGIGCRYPGGADSAEAFWDLLCGGVDAIREVPADRWDACRFYHPDAARPGKSVSRWGGFVDHIDQFDARFFGISPREAARIDPQQRMLLEVAWEALEDGGQAVDRLSGAPVGVFIGISTYDHGEIQHGMNDRELIDAHSNTGGALSIAANRISYLLDFKGPSLVVDTACSSSLVAMHLALGSLHSGECSMALVGGVNAVLKPESTIGFSRASMLSPDGRCKAFDARANGYTRGEGAGVVVLKPLAKAMADGDPIYAVVRGSAVNQDGRTQGMTVPSRSSQEAMLREAYRRAGIAPAQVRYVEAHGTGTPVGDSIETQALGTVLATGRPADQRCVIGSVKTNIGHLEAGAGAAGLIKAALVLKHRRIPPNLHFQEPNPNIPFDALQLRVPTTLEPLPNGDGPAYVGVNSFGFGGTNAHVVLEEPPVRAAEEGNSPNPESDRAWLLPLSARGPEALQAQAKAMRDYLAQADFGAGAAPGDLGAMAGLRRSHHDHRLALVGRTRQDLSDHLAAFLAGENRPGMSSGRAKSELGPGPVFVFSGMGPQWWAMGRQLLDEEPLFRKTVEECDALFRPLAGWSLLEELTADESRSRMGETEVAQPTTFALQVALAALWRSWGIERGAIVGHSAGEVAAACVAGALSLPDAVQVIFHRSRLQQRASGKGKMAAVGLPLEEVQRLLADYPGRVSIAAVNSPTSVTLSGDADALAEIVGSLEEKLVFCRFLRVDVPYHSHHMEAFRDELAQSLAAIDARPTTTDFFSTVTGDVLDGRGIDAAYWWQNVREPVYFAAAVDRLIDAGHRVFLELSPHPVLAGTISECLVHRKEKGTILPSLRRQEPERAVMLGSLGALYTLGYSVAWDRLYPDGARCVRLPSYPWQRERYWTESIASRTSRLDRQVHPLLGRRTESAQPVWETDMDADLLPYLKDHLIQGTVVFPGAAYVEMALSAGKEMYGDGPRTVEEVEFQRVLFLPDGDPPRVQTVLDPVSSSLQIYSRAGAAQGEWTRHAVAVVPQDGSGPAQRMPLEKIRARCSEEATDACYPFLARHGIEVGTTFQNVKRLWLGEREAFGELVLHESLAEEFSQYQFHPAFLDGCFQLFLGTLFHAVKDDGRKGTTYLPVKIDRLRIHERPTPRMLCHARLNRLDDDVLEGDIETLDEAGNVLVEIRGFRCQAVERAKADVSQNLEDWLYEFQWQAQPHKQPRGGSDFVFPGGKGSWLLFAGGAAGETLRDLLAAHGQHPVLVSAGDRYDRLEDRHFQVRPERPEDFRELMETVRREGGDCRGIVHLWGLEASEPAAESPESAQCLGSVAALHMVQAVAKVDWEEPPRLWLVTRGTQAVGAETGPVAIAQSPLWGLGRVMANEHPELRPTLVDLGPEASPLEIGALFEELRSDEDEEEIALRGGERFVRRLNRFPRKTSDSALPEKVKAAEHQPFYLANSRSGVLDHLALTETTRRAPGPGEVEIEVRAAGLNFMDVLKAMGLYPADDVRETLWLGSECAGRIVAVGDGVGEYAVGDEVVVLAPGCFRSFVTIDAHLAAPKPPHLSFEEATTIPLVFLTAYYGLHELARMRAGERVLIHSATGGVGLAAIQLARLIGAEVFATAGSPEKREYLRSLGVEHVMDSRSLAFADDVMEITGGEGVDLVLNSLVGEAIPKSLSVLRAYGRFLEIGKRDIYQNSKLGLRPFRDNLSLHAIDVSRLCLQRPEVAGELLRELMQLFQIGRLQPLPRQVFPISQIVGAFRQMQQAKHIGKIVISLEDPDVWIHPASQTAVSLRSDATYLITGGLGGFGLAVAQWMAQRGARHLVLVGRSGAASAEAAGTLQALEQSGVQVVAARADVSQKQSLADVLARIERSMPPLRGVVHAAAVFDDGFLFQLNRQRFEAVMAPKAIGAWNLHQQTLKHPLDFFVLFSSFSSMVGNPGQGNYAAANAFLDTLAHYRRSQGLPAMAVNWGAIGEMGYLTRHGEIVEHFQRQGLAAFSREETFALLEELMRRNPVQAGAIHIDWPSWGRFCPATARSPRFSHLVDAADRDSGAEAGSGNPLLQTLRATAQEERPAVLADLLCQQIARVLGTSPSNLGKEQPLTDFGLDSMMAVELNHLLEEQLGVGLSTMALLQAPHIADLAAQLLAQLDGELSTEPAAGDIAEPEELVAAQ